MSESDVVGKMKCIFFFDESKYFSINVSNIKFINFDAIQIKTSSQECKSLHEKLQVASVT